jgi:antitoxin HicB
MNKNPHIGESFESFLRDEGIYDEVAATAMKRTNALHTKHEAAAQNFSKSELARRLKTGAKQLGMRSDAENDGKR